MLFGIFENHVHIEALVKFFKITTSILTIIQIFLSTFDACAVTRYISVLVFFGAVIYGSVFRRYFKILEVACVSKLLETPRDINKTAVCSSVVL